MWRELGRQQLVRSPAPAAPRRRRAEARSTGRARRSASCCRTPPPRRAGSPPTRTELASQCTKYNLDCKIYNANGSASTQQQQAQQLISWGAGVIPCLLRVDLDSSSGAQIEKLAKSKRGVVADRLRPAHPGRRRVVLRVLRQREGRRGLQGRPRVKCPQVRPGRASGSSRSTAPRPTTTHSAFARATTGCSPRGRAGQMVARQDGNWDAPTARPSSTRSSARTRTSRPSWSPTTRWPVVITDLKRQSLRQGRGLRAGRHRGGPAEHPRRCPVLHDLQAVGRRGRPGAMALAQIVTARSPTPGRDGDGPASGRRSRRSSPPRSPSRRTTSPSRSTTGTRRRAPSARAIARLCNKHGINYTPQHRTGVTPAPLSGRPPRPHLGPGPGLQGARRRCAMSRSSRCAASTRASAPCTS